MVVIMKVKTYIFVISTAVLMLILPAYNLVANSSLFTKPTLLENMKSLYNMDSTEGEVGYLAYLAGISVEPNKVLVGKNGWLFLGNGYANTLIAKRDGVNSSNEATVKSLHDTMHSWKEYLQQHGVKKFIVTIGPDKDSIYTDMLPGWDQHSKSPIIRRIINDNKDIYIDTLTPMLEAKKASSVPLYFYTDTHWNHYGSSVVFNLLRHVMDNSEMEWTKEFNESDFNVSNGTPGDLAAFLRTNKIRDIKVDIKSPEINGLNVDKIDYTTGNTIAHEKLIAIEAPTVPTLIVSDNALSNKKVLWLRDSFGNAMSPFMSREFKETLQIHHGRVTPRMMKDMVESFKPDSCTEP